MTQQRSLLTAFPLFLALFIDGMGLGILFPVLTALLTGTGHSILPDNMVGSLRNLIFGITIASFAIAWFVGAPILSDLSDRIGRKKPLVLSLLGTFIGYLLSALAVIAHSLSLLIIGRVIAGFTAGSQPIAQAAIIDLSTAQTKTRNLGYILFAVSLGFVFGPILGAFLSNPNLISWFNFTTPFYFAALISLLNALFIMFTFKETFHYDGKLHIRWNRAIELFADAFRHKTVRFLSIAFLFLELSWGSYFSFSSLFLHHKFHFTTNQIGFYIALMAGGFGIGFSYVVNLVSKHFSLKPTVAVTASLQAVFIFITAWTPNPFYAWLVVIFLGINMAVAYSSSISLYSNLVDEKHQGWAMGISNAVGAASFGLATLISGFIAEIGLTTTLVLSGCCALLSAVLILLLKQLK